MRNAAIIVLSLLALSASGWGQSQDEVLATSTGRTYRMSDLPQNVREALAALPGNVAAVRKAVFDQIVDRRLLELEGKALGVSPGRLIAAERAKIADPTPAQIKRVYDDNREALAGQTLDEARAQIVAFLRNAPERKVIGELYSRLRAKYKFSAGKDINAPDLAPGNVVATIAGTPITAREFDEAARVAVFELKAAASDSILDALDDLIYNTLVAEDAAEAKVAPDAYLAREITNKMKDFSDGERFALEQELSRRLAEKYKVNVLYKPLEPIVQSISVDDDPSLGPTDAPVTIVMFSDFQCSACAATHPIIKSVVSEFTGKVRLVVRDFPLESIHENAFKAALAANAAHAQGKFFEFAEILYQRQKALDGVSLKKYAAEIGLNARQFALDFNSSKAAAEVRKDLADGESYVVNSTPTIFVNGVRVRNVSADALRLAVERALKK